MAWHIHVTRIDIILYVEATIERKNDDWRNRRFEGVLLKSNGAKS